MKLGDLVRWHGKPALILAEGMAVSDGTIWEVLTEGKVMAGFEEDMELISEGQ